VVNLNAEFMTRRAALLGINQPTVKHPDFPLATPGDPLVMSRDQECSPVSTIDLDEQIHHLIGTFPVEVPGRLVGENQLWGIHQRARHRYTLLLAAGELGRKEVSPIGQSDSVE
jgi:hypothetical protein